MVWLSCGKSLALSAIVRWLPVVQAVYRECCRKNFENDPNMAPKRDPKRSKNEVKNKTKKKKEKTSEIGPNINLSEQEREARYICVLLQALTYCYLVATYYLLAPTYPFPPTSY